MKRGEIHLADLDPTRGSEQAGRRPVQFTARPRKKRKREGDATT